MNKKLLIRLFSIISVSVLLVSCNPVKQYIDEMDSLVSDAEQNGKDYTESDWQDFAESFAACQEELNEYNGELTREDYRELGSISARYHKVILAYSMDALKSGLNASSSFMQGYMDEMGNGESLDQMGKDFESAMIEVEKDFDKILSY